jgi:hypothetical protein
MAEFAARFVVRKAEAAYSARNDDFRTPTPVVPGIRTGISGRQSLQIRSLIKSEREGGRVRRACDWRKAAQSEHRYEYEAPSGCDRG